DRLADAVILDLEDAVLPDAKAAARTNLISAAIDPDRVIVRVNAPSSEHFAADLEARRCR
ncbi:aldolase/citrate lyase family protein, partial [Bacillus sp. SIMBA_008]|uniref:aldolase/citrate lyase family protein n=1 Tax=Bacillus sp. SIMBA_008 TaxID=3085757 RepID=UPI00397A39CB